MNSNDIILVNMYDKPCGTTTKSIAHRIGLLHRAFSLFVFNSNDELLIQKRSENKYHSGGLWANTCCSHPHPNIEIYNCIIKRLADELGISVQKLEEIGNFVYREEFADNLYEFEFDHVYIGRSDDSVVPNSEEVADYKWVKLEWIASDVMEHPDDYASWFVTALSIVINNNKIFDIR